MLNRRHFLAATPTERFMGEDYWLHISRKAMACLFEVTLPFSERFGVPVARDALDEIQRLERQLTVFQDSSEVSFINRNAAVRKVSVEGSLFELLQLCRKINRDTEGAFDISSGPLTRCWGFFKRQGRIPHSDELENAMAVVGGDKVILDSESRAIRFALSGVEINFGSIGKGYALDRVSALVRRHVSSALLSAGSSSICALGSGDPDESGWSVGIRHSRDKSRRLALLRMRNCAMSTSGSEEQFFEHDGRRYGHIIDPRSGRPADLVSSVTVVAGSAAIADALATGFYVGGRELAERYCAAHTNVLVIMLESKSEDPVVIGSHSGCKVAII